jgi:hypothetical protein
VLNTEQGGYISGAHVAYKHNGLIQIMKTWLQYDGLSVKQKLTGHCQPRRWSDEQ